MLDVTVHLFPGSRPLILERVVASYEMSEALHELSELKLVLLLSDPELRLADVVGHRALVQFANEPLQPHFDGIVRRVRQLSAEPTGVSRYELVVVPTLWLTTRRTDHRIFQNLSVPDIIDAALLDYRGRIEPAQRQLVGVHARREYCAEYGETDCDFIHRVLADAGITSCFFPAPQGVSPATVWTILDDTTLGKDLVARLEFLPPSNLIVDNPHVLAVFVTTDVETSLVTARDYDFEKPEFILERTAVASEKMFENEGETEAYVYEVGKFANEAQGDARARQLLEERRCQRRVLQCHTNVAIAPGSRFLLSGHPRADINGELVVVRSRTIVNRAPGSKATQSHVLDCIPASQPFRPGRRPKPRIHGTQTAFVVTNQAGVDEIDVDDLGRVKLEFRWDRRDLHEGAPTRRVRVSQAWAGAGYGLVTIPRSGDEVVVAYLDGDPDEPIVIGRVHNGFNQTPLKLPEQQTQSVWRSRSSPFGDGFNQILMEDKAGAERLDFRAQRDSNTEVVHDQGTTVGNNQTMKITGAQSFSAGSHSTSAGTISFHAGTTLMSESGTSTDFVAGGPFRVGSPFIQLIGQFIVQLLAGSVIELKANSTVKIHGATSVDVTSDSGVNVTAPRVRVAGATNVDVQGGSVDVNATGDVHVRGGTVNLNC
jgi:type VI secretion system secreted protein VgrG